MGDKVVAKNSVKDLVKPEGSGLTGADRLFDSDDEEDDAELKEQIEAAYKTTDIIEELKLSETSSSSDSGSSDTDDEDANLDAAKERPENPDVEKTKKPGPATVTDAPAEPAGSGNPGGPESEVMPEQNPSKTPGAKGKGPSSGNSGKAPASKVKLSTAAEGVRERAQTTLFGGAALAQAMGSEEEEEVTRHLENYTGLLDGFQKLVGIMANGYEDATEDIRSLVASMLDAATERDRTFVAGASQALAKWTTTYQEAMSQGERGSIPEQLARWDRVREAGVALSRQVTSLTTARDPSTTSGEIFQRLLPACFDRVRLRTEATFSTLNANLPSLLCRFVRPDQAGQIFSSIFTCMCNYNTEVCGMAMAQTVVPVYTIPNTYRVQQSLWESLCRIIPGIAHTDATSGAGGSGDPGTTAMQGDSQPASAPQTSHKKRTSREKQQGEAPLGIPPARSTWVASSEFQNLLVVNLTGDDNPSTTRPQSGNAPIQATPLTGRRVSGGKINVSKVDAHHLIWKMEDRQEAARQRAEAEASDRASSRGRGSLSGLPYGLPAALPDLAAEGGILAKSSDPTPAAPKQGKKCSHADDDDEITELPTRDEPVVPPKRKKKKKSKDKAKEEVPVLDRPDDGARPGSSSAKPEGTGGPTPAADPPGIPDEETEQPKKKKKKKKNKEDPGLEKFREQEREAKAKEIARNIHRKLQRDLDFRSVRKYREKISPELLETINGADHSGFLVDKLTKDGNYMSQKNGYRRNLMTTERLLARIAKHAENPEQRLEEAQAFVRATFPKGSRDDNHGEVLSQAGSPDVGGLLQ